MISIVSPVYKAEGIVEKLVFEIEKTMKKMSQEYEIILVDDSSPDDSWSKMKRISESNTKVKSVRLSKNFGQHPAIMAGLSLAKGEWIVVMDCDLQDQPKEIEKLFNKAQAGFDIVLARRENRKDSFFKRITSKIFYILYSYLTETKFDSTIANFGIYNRRVIAEVIRMNDYIKAFPLFVNWVGFKSISIEVVHSHRESGVSSYNLSKLTSLAFNTIISFSNKPLKLFVKFGLSISVFSFAFGIITVYRYFMGEIVVLGYSSLIVSIWFLSGVIITTIGVVGIYIGKIFDQTKGRKSYIIDDMVN
jgi:dolichol-phosphate mannosyltransferase